MSQEGIEAHEMLEKMEELEHESRANKSEATRVAILSALLALCAAVSALQSEHTQALALLHKNQAVLLQNQASDQWSYYQAKSIKLELVKMQAALRVSEGSPADRIRKYEGEQRDITTRVHGIEHARDEALAESEFELHRHHWFSYALTAFQVSIVLTTVSLIVRRRPLWWMGAAGGAAGLALLGRGFF